MWHVFHFMFYILHLMILNPSIVFKIVNLHWTCLYLLFHMLPCKQIVLERTSTEKLEFKCLNGMFGMVWFFEILKTFTFVFMKIVARITKKHANILCYTLTCCNPTFLLFKHHPNEVDIYLSYIHQGKIFCKRVVWG